jgi:hypothetical protein
MPSQVLNPLEVEAFEVSVRTDTCGDSAWAASLSEAPAYELAPDAVSAESAQDGSCVKGLITALGIEATVGFTGYCIWQLLHAAR